MDYLPLNPLTMAISGVGVLTAVAVRHYAQHKKIVKESSARGSFLFDEAFSVMKYFFEKAVLHTVEEAQAFGNNFTPAPYWVRVVRVLIPLDTRLEANRVLIDTLGEEDMKNVVGGKEWWQRTPNPSGGVRGEWISMKRDWQGLGDDIDDDELDKVKHERIEAMKRKAAVDRKRRYKQGKEREEKQNKGQEVTDEGDEGAYEEDMDEMRCIMYVHGGAYFFGSPNTHRYSIWRYARKIGGRAFALQYRLAPQYPFPCALADALAAYIYLIRPPPGAKHKPVDPARLTVAGDSAGGGLTLALVCLIRDAGLPLPAGIVLISPWCDLTHSFPSILENTHTDVIPAFGLGLFKPSVLWPPPPAEFQERANRQTSIKGLKNAAEKLDRERSASHKHGLFGSNASRTDKKGEKLRQEVEGFPDDPQRAENTNTNSGSGQEGTNGEAQANGESKAEVGKVLKLKIDGEDVELHDQIQLYATNEQLVYPFVSPIWQPSLGGLPPMYVMCGDAEVLRDEIIYMAHRAAHPDRYPIRQALLDANPERAKKQAAYPPTKVHLQVYDGICHDLPLFSFTTPAKYCYRAISSFVKYVTADETEKGESLASPVSATGMELPVEAGPSHSDVKIHEERAAAANLPPRIDSIPTSPKGEADTSLSPNGHIPNGHSANGHANERATGLASSASTIRSKRSAAKLRTTASTGTMNSATSSGTKKIANLEKTIYTSTQPFNRPPWVDNMVRERVSLTGVVRPLEPEDEMSLFKIPKEDMGMVKEGPVKRYLAGKAMWDKKFKRTYERVQKKREHHLKKSMREEASRISAHLKARSTKPSPKPNGTVDHIATPPRHTESPEPIEGSAIDADEEEEASPIGIWSLPGERPPPSSIAARKDTLEARQLARVLNERYSKLSALNVWNEVHRMANKAAEPPQDDVGSRR